jgi:hypothetical protein
MKISDAIKKLQKVIGNTGDTEISIIYDNRLDYNELEDLIYEQKVTIGKYKNTQNVVVISRPPKDDEDDND